MDQQTSTPHRGTGSPVQIVRGEPSDEELAATIAVLTELTGTGTAERPVARHTWADPASRLRTPLHRGPWRTSLRDHRA